MPSFDVVSEPDMHEVQNAFDQALREVRQRYDFQGTDAALEQLDDNGFKAANSEERFKQWRRSYKISLSKGNITKYL